MSNVYRIIGDVVINGRTVAVTGDVVLLECRMRTTSAIYKKDADGENDMFVVSNEHLKEIVNEQYPITPRRVVAPVDGEYGENMVVV